MSYWLQRGGAQAAAAAAAAQLNLATAPALAARASCSVLSQRCLLGRKTGKSPLLLSTQLSERAHQPLAHTVEVVATDGVKAKVLCLCATRWHKFRKSVLIFAVRAKVLCTYVVNLSKLADLADLLALMDLFDLINLLNLINLLEIKVCNFRILEFKDIWDPLNISELVDFSNFMEL